MVKKEFEVPFLRHYTYSEDIIEAHMLSKNLLNTVS